MTFGFCSCDKKNAEMVIERRKESSKCKLTMDLGLQCKLGALGRQGHNRLGSVLSLPTSGRSLNPMRIDKVMT